MLVISMSIDKDPNSPHMRKLYGDDLRKDAGLTKVIKKVTKTQARLLKQRAPELDRVAQEVRGTFEKVYEETTSIVEDFLAKCESCALWLHGLSLTYCIDGSETSFRRRRTR